jgi:putative effector of murein hydrolase LrgA (UPF0299 family)
MFTLLQHSYKGSIVGSIILFFPLVLYVIPVLFGTETVKTGTRFLAKEYARFFIGELPNLIGIVTFMSFIAIFTTFAYVFFVTLALLLIYVYVKAVAYRNELANNELPEYYKTNNRNYIGHWRWLTFCACLVLFDLILYIGSDFAEHSQGLH